MDIIIPKQNHFFDKFYRFPHFPNSYYYGIIFSENNYFQRGATIMKILFYDTKSYDREFFEKLLPSYPGIEIKFIEANIHEETAALAHGYDAICAFVNADLGAPVIEELHRQGVKLILMRCAGYNNVDLETTAKCGIQVARVPGYSPEAVAEHAMALALTANRHTHKAYIKCRENNFALNGLMGVNFYQKTAGIIGTGKIARILIRILQGFGMKVVAYDLYPDEKYAREVGISYVSLDGLYAQADMISLHVPLTDQTKNMIDAQSIAKMKEGTIIINTSRGQLIHTNALIEGLKSKKIAAAGLDVYEEEEGYFYEDQSDKIIDDDVLARLLSFNNVIVTSHQGFFTREAMHNIAETTLQNIQDFIDGKTLVNEVS